MWTLHHVLQWACKNEKKITLVGVGVGVGVGVVQFMVLFLEKRKKPFPHYAY